MFENVRRQVSVAVAIAAFSLVLAFLRPAYFSSENLSELLLANLPVLIVGTGMTLVMLTGEIDISVGSQFAVCGIVAGSLAKTGISPWAAVIAAIFAGALLGALNGWLVAFARIPSIVVTLASMVVLRDGLRWITQGAWVDNLPRGFQWLGLSPPAYEVMVIITAAILACGIGLGLGHLRAGRAIVATGSNAEGARLIGIGTGYVVFSVFSVTGALTGLAAALNSVRFNQIPSNTGLGLEMKVIAAVVLGGTSITGGRGGVAGTVLGVVVLGMIGPALTFLGINAYWEKALQGSIILTAVLIDALSSRRAESYV
jgi:rhamnose transport system permease protein